MVSRLMDGAFFLFMGIAAWQDARKRSISLKTFLWAAMLGIGLRLGPAKDLGGTGEPWQNFVRLAGDMSLGSLLLGLSVLTKEGIGRGDGWFFLVSGIYLGFWKNLLLLWGSLMLCFPVSLFLFLRGRGKGYRIPFLPFVFLAGLGVLLL